MPNPPSGYSHRVKHDNISYSHLCTLSPLFLSPTLPVVTQSLISQLLSKLPSLWVHLPLVSRRGIGIWLLEFGVIVALQHIMLHHLMSCHIMIVISWSLRTNLVLRTQTLPQTYREELPTTILLPQYHWLLSMKEVSQQATYDQSTIKSPNCE